MEELVVKKDFTNIYTKDSPYEYLKEMKRLSYRIPDYTKPLYIQIAQQLVDKLKRPIHIVDLGSSYGINSSLMRHDLSMSELDQFFLRKDTPPTRQDSFEFFKKQDNQNLNFNFYQIDISEPALKFSKDVGLCKNSICVNLESDYQKLPDAFFPIDMVIATGCIGYIGYKAFSNLFELIKKQKPNLPQSNTQDIFPTFTFSVLRIFDIQKISKTFDYYGYSLKKTDLQPIPQRQFADSEEKNQTLSLLHSKGIDTKWYEDDGNFYADFYVGVPKTQKKQLVQINAQLRKHHN